MSNVEGEYSDTVQFHLESLKELVALVAPTPADKRGSIELGRFMKVMQLPSPASSYVLPSNHLFLLLIALNLSIFGQSYSYWRQQVACST